MELLFVFFTGQKETDFEVLTPTNKRRGLNIYGFGNTQRKAEVVFRFRA